MNKTMRIFFLAGISLLVSCTPDGDGPLDPGTTAESFTMQVSGSSLNKSYTDALLTQTDVTNKGLTGYTLPPNYNDLQSLATGDIRFYSTAGTPGNLPDSHMGFEINNAQSGTYSLVELHNSSSGESFDLNIGNLTLIPESGSLKIMANTETDPNDISGTGILNATISGTFHNEAVPSDKYTISASLSVN